MLKNFCYFMTLTLCALNAFSAEIDDGQNITNTGKIVIISTDNIPFNEILADIKEKTILLLPQNKINLDNDINEINNIKPVKIYYMSGEVESRVIECSREFNIERVIGYGEFDILRAARLRDYLKLPGQDYQSALAFRDKVIMKERLKNAGIHVPAFKSITNPCDLVEFIEDHGYPAVFKHRRGAGSKDTFIIRDNQDLNNILREKGLFNDYYELNYEVEKFISGTLYHVNGIFSSGKVIFAWPSVYTSQPIECVSGKYTASHILSEKNPLVPQFSKFAEEVLQALPTPETTVFHLEAFLTPQQEMVVCEIASRAGGGGINKNWIKAFDIDLKREHIRLQAGLPLSAQALSCPSSPKIITGEIMVAKKSGNLLEIPQTCPLNYVESYNVYAQAGKKYKQAIELAETAAEFSLVVGGSEEEIKNNIQDVVDWFYNNTKWED